MTLEQVLTNGYFYLACTSIVLVVAVLVLLAQRAESSTTVKWFHVYVWGMLATSIAQAMLFFGESARVFDVAQTTTAVGVVFIINGLFYFVLHYLNKRSWIENYWLNFFVIVSSLAIIVLSLRTHLLYAVDPALRVRNPWGYFPSHWGKYYYPVFVGWANVLHILSVVLLIQGWRRTIDRRRKRQMLIIICGLMVPFLVVSFTYNILPIFGITVLPAATYSEAIMGGVLTYALLRYGSSVVDPSAITASVVRTMNSAALALDNENRIVLANTAAGEFVGRPGEQLMGVHVRELVAPQAWKEFDEQILRASHEGVSRQAVESAVATKGGKFAAVNVYSSPYHDKRRRNVGTILVFADIQRLKDLLADANRLGRELAEEKKSVEAKVVERTHELHVERAKLQAAIESLPLGFMLVDTHGAVAMHNLSLRKIVNMQHMGASLHAFSKKFQGLDLAKVCKQVQESGETAEFSEVGMGARIVRIFVGPVQVREDNTVTAEGALVLVEDITEEKVLARSRDEFFSIASHELRTPLTAIRGNSSMMINFYQKLLDQDPQFSEMTHDIYEGATRLIAIVNDFIDVSRVEQGKMHFRMQPLHLDKVIEQVVYEMKTISQEKHVAVRTTTTTLNALPPVWADSDRITQVLYNLVGNAVKFTDKGSVTIDAEAVDGVVKVSVIDTGRGIPLENQKLLFRKFQQAGDSLLTRDTTRGTGLGLYISKLIIENMGGSIKLEKTAANEGSTFSFTIPVATQEQLAQEPSGAMSTSAATSQG